MRRSALGGGNALGAVFARFVYTRINARKAHDGAAARKAAHIADLSHKLCGSCFSNAVHGPHSFVFRKLGCKPCHLCPQSSQRSLTRKKLLSGCDDEQLCVLVLRQRGEMSAAAYVEVPCFLLTEMVAFAFAPLLVTLCECLFADVANTVAVPKGHDKVYPFLVAVRTFWAGKKFVYTRKSLIGQRNEIILQRYHRFHVKVVLTAAQF